VPFPQHLNITPGGTALDIELDSPRSAPNNQSAQTRRYRLHLPASYSTSNTTPHPLLLTFAGQFQPTWSIENYTKFSDDSVNPHAIAVYPEGVGNQYLGDPTTPPATEIDDLQFVADLLDALEAQFCVDRARVYATGFSNGASLTGLLACNDTVGGRFAALGAVGGAYYADGVLPEPRYGAGCTAAPGRVVPYLEIHGTEDRIVRYDGKNEPVGADTVPIPVWLEKVAELNGCVAAGPESAATLVPGLRGLDDVGGAALEHGTVQRLSWGCRNLTDLIVHYKVAGLGHGWPSTVYFGGILDEYRGGPTTWNASAVFAEWFGKWSLASSWGGVQIPGVTDVEAAGLVGRSMGE
jgi:poly(3-hydroxybutyrate) depolymerase